MIDRYTELLNTFDEITAFEWASFFHDNAARIDTLVSLFEGYNRTVMNTQAKRLRELKRLIRNITNDDHWTDMEGLELTYHHFNPPLHIRGSFHSGVGNALATFSIEISTPTIQAWNHYEDQLINHYTNHEPVIMDNKTILHIATLPGEQEDRILATLMELHFFISSLSFRTFSHSLTSH
ncbi:hypothetical protein [Chitinophaga sp. S165]|uniref:hypothetical protein n=1 Tax=Chitinophaga sp. S165 TaxID=2135462 RepID=UPI000D70F339|nr:hypothetical protein [Chitinophaga sp. S165]PWV54531.1 hypothetical protein C7475_1021291 [Chitinophaga sp. S165]